MGQGYDDIIPFDSNRFIDSLFEGGAQVGESIEHVTSVQKISEITVENAKSEIPQTVREEQEEEKDTVLLPKPPVKTSNPMDQLALPEQQQEAKEIAPKAIVDRYEASEIKEQPKEKKSRFGFFGKKRTDPDRGEEEEGDKKQKPKLEEKWTDEQNEKATLKEEEEEEWQSNERKRNVREDKGTKVQEEEQDKVVYLTDEDIEDLLK
jgi:hypothetical protein